MAKIALQYKNKAFFPVSDSDREKTKHLLDNQILEADIKVSSDQPVLRQLRLYWVLCQKVAENLEDFDWNTKEKVDLQLRIYLRFFDKQNLIFRKNIAVVCPWSVSASNIARLKKFDYFRRAFNLMATRLHCSVTELLNIGNDND